MNASLTIANIVLNEDTLISYETERGKERLTISAIQNLWTYADVEEIEGIRVYTPVLPNTIMMLLSIASGQGGVVVCWNTEERCVKHISAAPYTVALSYYDNMIYMLNMVCDYATPAHFTLGNRRLEQKMLGPNMNWL